MPQSLLLGDDVPDAGEPVRHEGEEEHQQGEYDGAVLGVAVHLLQEAREPQQPGQLHQVNVAVTRFLQLTAHYCPTILRAYGSLRLSKGLCDHFSSFPLSLLALAMVLQRPGGKVETADASAEGYGGDTDSASGRPCV